MESTSSPERRKAVEELVRGRDFTSQLQRVLINTAADTAADAAAEELVVKILRSFSDTLSILSSSQSEDASCLATGNSPPSDYRKSDDSCESSKSSALIKDRRGCYKRRKTTQTWTRTTATLVDDGHAWRKYGQKIILNTKHPRNYYRCTHKFDQGCQATKQVQKTDAGDQPMYQITYNGHHTCRNLVKAPQIILESSTPSRDSSTSILLSFDPSSFHSKHDHPFFSMASSPFPMLKNEYVGDRDSDLGCCSHNHHHHHHHHNTGCGHQASSDPYLLSSDITVAFDSGDVLSTVASRAVHNLDMDMVVGPVNFTDDVLQFEF